MRQVGQLTSEKDARRFVAWLTTQQIEASVEQDNTGWNIWVRDEDNLASARTAITEFSGNPSDPRYSNAEKKAESLRREQEAKREQARRNQVQMRDKWGAASGTTARRSPLTMILIGACIIVSLMSNFGQDPRSSVTRGLIFADRIGAEQAARETTVPIEISGTTNVEIEESVRRYVTWYNIRRGEVWRLFTPMLVHFGVTHVVFNMVMLYSFGGQIENRYGTLRMLLLVLVLAGLSNVGQAIAEGPGFGGMSGVVYGLFGFAWMRATYDPNSRLHLDQITVLMLLVWFVLCIATEIPAFQPMLGRLFGGGVANVAHAVGLVVGMAIGIPWSRFLTTRSP